MYKYLKLTINNKGFASALSIGGAMAGRVKSMPILDCVKIAVSGGNAKITSFDNECAIAKKTSILSVEEQGEFCINPKDLGRVLKTINDEEVTLNVGDTTCEIIHSNGSLSLPVLPAKDFPIPVKDDDAKTFKVSAAKFFNVLKNAHNYVSSDEIRPILTGVYIEISDSGLVVSASDSRKLYFDGFEIPGSVGEVISDILPSKAIPAALSAMNGEESINISFGEKNIVIRASDTKITCRKIVGKYPNVRSIIPKDNAIRVKVDRSLLKDAICRAMLTADATNKILRMSISAFNELGVQSEDTGFGKKCTETIQCEDVSGIDGEFVIGVRGDLLLDGINSVESEFAVLEFSSPKKAFLILDGEYLSKKIVIMPFAL